MRRPVIVVSGGATTEHEVSRASGRDVVATLARDPRYLVVDTFVDRDGAWHVGGEDAPGRQVGDVLDDLPADAVVFPVLHGGWGEGGGLQHELEVRSIPFVGNGAKASRAALSKRETLRLCAAAGVGVIPTRCVDRARYLADPDLVVSAIRRSVGDVVIKPDTGGSSIGVHVVTAGTSLRAAFADAFADDAVALVQPLVTGDEVSVGVWQDEDGVARATGASLLHLPHGGSDAGFSYAHKYEGAGAVLEIPAALPADTLDALRSAALRCFDAIGGRGMARVDFFVGEGGGILLNEINTIPGLRHQSHFPRLVAAAGTAYPRLLELLVDAATSTTQVTPKRSVSIPKPALHAEAARGSTSVAPSERASQ